MISTQRLLLTEANETDAEFIYQLLNSPNWIEFIGDRGIDSEDKAQQYIQETLIASYKTHGFGLYKVELKLNHQPIGLCGILKRPNLSHPDIGYAILPEFEGYGYISEAAEATLDFAKQSLKLQTLLAITNTKNKVSQHLLDKMGFNQTTNNEYHAGEDEMLYEIRFE